MATVGKIKFSDGASYDMKVKFMAMEAKLKKMKDQRRKLKRIIEDIDSRFESGNDVPVERITLKRSEWEKLKKGE